MNQKIAGYVTSDRLKSGYIPQHIQNLLIKNYIGAQANIFLLSWTEYKDRSPLVLDSLLNETFYDGICFYSIEQLLPLSNSLEYLYALKKRNLWIGFAKEGLHFDGDQNFDPVLRIWWLLSSFSQDKLTTV